jgi:hypothetical protein
MGFFKEAGLRINACSFDKYAFYGVEIRKFSARSNRVKVIDNGAIQPSK